LFFNKLITCKDTFFTTFPFPNITSPQAVCIHLTNLEVLKLSWSVSITDKGLLGLTPERSHLIDIEAVTADEKIGEITN